MTEAETDGDGMDEISQLLNDYTSLQAAHRSLLQRYESHTAESNADAHEEIDTLRARVKELQAELERVSGEKEVLSATVRDLRVRVEESRRAIMRLQGGGSTSGAGSLGSSGTQSGHSGGAAGGGGGGAGGAGSHANRRSMGPAALASWNPREAASSGFNPAAPSNPSDQQSYDHHTPEEAAELKRSKRASLAFGPNAQGTIGRKAHGHRRIASGSRIGVNDEEGQGASMGPPSSSAQGLRELHLGGTSAMNGTSSKRSSIYAAATPHNVFSPASDTSDLPLEEGGERATTSGSLLMPSRSIRRTSNSSSLSGSARDDLEGHLAIPGGGSRTSLSPSPSNFASPILEAEETSGTGSHGRVGEEEEPYTARAIPGTSISSFGSLGAMQQQQSDFLILQRQLAEQKYRVQDRDARLDEMRKEMQAVKMELDEAREARLASESCLKALRDFVKDEGGRSTDSDGGAQKLKGVKLPPLPTDKDTDDMSNDSAFVPSTPARGDQPSDVNTPTQATAASTWRSFGNTFAGLSRAKSHTSEESASKGEGSGSGGTLSHSTTTPLSPSANIGSSIGTLWSRATATGKRDSVSVSSTVPSESTEPANSESRHTSMTSNSADSPSQTSVAAPPPAPFKGFTWFNKRTLSEETADEVSTPAVSTRVSSPPFANLDNHVLTIDQVQKNSLRKASVASSGSGKEEAVHSLTPNDRVRRAKEKSDVVDEDTGFVPPSF